MSARRWALAAFFLLASCHGSDHEHEDRVVEVEDVPKEIRIPVAVWDQIEGKSEHAAGENAEGGGHGGGGESKPAAPAGGGHGGGGGGEAKGADDSMDVGGGVLFMPVNVVLREKNPGVLTESPIKFKFPRGGGAIDLASYVTDKAGSFYVSFEWPEGGEGEGAVQSWFVSKARRRRIGDESWGAGCGHAFRLGPKFEKINATTGLKANTSRNRHLTVFGGHFIFATHKNQQTFSAQVTFKDSRRPEYFCEEL